MKGTSVLTRYFCNKCETVETLQTATHPESNSLPEGWGHCKVTDHQNRFQMQIILCPACYKILKKCYSDDLKDTRMKANTEMDAKQWFLTK